MTRFSESVIGDAALDWLQALGWRVAHGPDIAPGMSAAERTTYGGVILARRRRDALARLGPQLPMEALEDAFRKAIAERLSSVVVRDPLVLHLSTWIQIERRS